MLENHQCHTQQRFSIKCKAISEKVKNYTILMNFTSIHHLLINSETCLKDYIFPDWNFPILKNFSIENNITREKSNLKTPNYIIIKQEILKVMPLFFLCFAACVIGLLLTMCCIKIIQLNENIAHFSSRQAQRNKKLTIYIQEK